MLRWMLLLPVLFVIAAFLGTLKLVLRPYVYMYGWLAPWIFFGCIALLIVLELVSPSKEDEDG